MWFLSATSGKPPTPPHHHFTQGGYCRPLGAAANLAAAVVSTRREHSAQVARAREVIWYRAEPAGSARYQITSRALTAAWTSGMPDPPDLTPPTLCDDRFETALPRQGAGECRMAAKIRD